MSLTINHQTDDISNLTGAVTFNGVAVGGDNSPPEFFGDRGIVAGGFDTSSTSNVIQYVAIPTTGNATDFGDLTLHRYQLGAFSGEGRGVFAGGYSASGATGQNTIDYITISTTGNATDFGDLTIANRETSGSGCSNGLRGLIGGGKSSPSGTLVSSIDYVTIATTGNAQDFGDLTGTKSHVSSCSNGSRGVFAGGNSPDIFTVVNVIEYVTIDTTGNATDFGDLTVARNGMGAAGNTTRGIFAGGGVFEGSNVIDYITIATTGNATDFGDLITEYDIQQMAGTNNATRAIFAGGEDGGARQNGIQYITIDTTGNGTDFGDLTSVQNAAAGTSGN